ncbi:hypothetical protein SBY92_000960 [Candida maltosa Xu316]|uniref:Uncharacterized protein n=1 Tax=Candida maltosa (strain Xu316) TaxID=1245528 RepID=M3HG27_CANMX|nr:hypothetical protein G210_3568 [Candida maltosa Xu316]
MTVLDLKTGKPHENPTKINRQNSKISRNQKDTGIKFSWIYELDKLSPKTIEPAETIVNNVLDRGEYFQRPENAVGVLVHSGDEPIAVAAWYGADHKGDWNIYGDQPEHTQQVYFLSGANTVFVGLF